MSRVVKCDGCGELIGWVEGSKDRLGASQPPLTLRGGGRNLDFHDEGCALLWAKRAVAERR